MSENNSEWYKFQLEVDPRTLLYLIIVFVIIDNVWEIILTKRQVIVCQSAIFVPEDLRALIPPEVYLRGRIFEMHKAELEIWKHFIDIIFSCCELYFGFYPAVWGLATRLLSSATDEEIWISVIFMFLLSSYVVLRFLPILAYDKFLLELRYGMARNLTCGVFLCFAAFGLFLSQIIIAPVTMLIVVLVQLVGYFFFLWMWVLSLICTIVMLFVVPLLVIPTIGNQKPLAEGPLQTDLKRLTDAVGFPIERVYIIQTKARIQYSNAYFYGCCCLKRIVIFDTLLLNKGKTNINELQPYEIGRGLTNPQVAGVVAHELGHWKNNHFCKSMIIVKLHFLVTMFLFGLFFHSSSVYEAVGFEPGLCPIIVGFIIVMRYVLRPYLAIANFLMLTNLRHYEFQADKFAHKMGYSMALRAALLKIYADNMGFPVYDPYYSMWHHTHPTILQRLQYQQVLDMRALVAQQPQASTV